MDKVFVSNGGNGNWRNRIRNFSLNRDKDANNDVLTEYFPYAGGDGIDEFAYSTSSMSYSPVDVMQESTIQLEQPMGLGRHARRILVRGSKYDVYDSRSPPISPKCTEMDGSVAETTDEAGPLSVIPPRNVPNTRSLETYTSNHQQLVSPTDQSFLLPEPEQRPTKFSKALKRLSAPVRRKPVPNYEPSPADFEPPTADTSDPGAPTPITDMLAELLKLEWTESVPTSLPQLKQLVRSASRASRILAPMDAYVDGFEACLPGSELVFVGIELFSLMVVSHYVAKVVAVVCYPAVLLIRWGTTGF